MLKIKRPGFFIFFLIANYYPVEVPVLPNVSFLITHITVFAVVEESSVEGDLNGDGMITALDARKLACYAPSQDVRVRSHMGKKDEDRIIFMRWPSEDEFPSEG